MRQLFFFLLLSFLFFALVSPALASTTPSSYLPGYSSDPEAPGSGESICIMCHVSGAMHDGPPGDGYYYCLNCHGEINSVVGHPPNTWDPNCQVCHGAVENGFDPWITTESSAPISLTLQNIVKFTNKYMLQVVQVGETSATSPTIDLGDVDPSQTTTATFNTFIKSNARYYERYSWSDFTNADTGFVMPSNRMSVWVQNSGPLPGDPVGNNGVHPPVDEPAPPPAGGTPSHRPQSNWETIRLVLTPFANDDPGSYTGSFDITVTQI